MNHGHVRAQESQGADFETHFGILVDRIEDLLMGCRDGISPLEIEPKPRCEIGILSKVAAPARPSPPHASASPATTA